MVARNVQDKLKTLEKDHCMHMAKLVHGHRVQERRPEVEARDRRIRRVHHTLSEKECFATIGGGIYQEL